MRNGWDHEDMNAFFLFFWRVFGMRTDEFTNDDDLGEEARWLEGW